MLSDALVLDVDEASPVEVVGEERAGPFVVLCDHAGRALPRSLKTLGLSDTELEQHIAWDIGAAGVARELSRELSAPLFLQRYSRLVIDCNRPLTAADSIPAESGGITIPGNQQLTSQQAEARARAIFWPYHERIAAFLARRSRYVLVTIHSFTPELLGVRRPFHAGVLYAHDDRMAQRVLSLLRQDAELVVGDNEPYAASPTTDYSIIEYGERCQAPYVELEVRQDLVADPAGQALWAARFARVLRNASSRFHS